MRIGLQIPNLTFPGGPATLGTDLAAIAHTADESGFYSLWVMDHFFQLPMLGPVEHEMLEGYTTLTHLAAHTKNVKLGTMMTGVIYRYPGVLVKTVSTLDVLSGGRAYLGIGAGWFEREAVGLGIPFHNWTIRFEMLEETLQIAKQMWAGEVGPYEGKHFKLAETLNRPQPLSQPHPPIMIGGGGEKKTLRFVAKYADACNLFAQEGVEVLKHKLDVLKQHCDDVGRDYDEIEKTTLSTAYIAEGQMTPDDVIAHCQELAGIGIQHAVFNMPMNAHELTPIRIFGEKVIPVVADL